MVYLEHTLVKYFFLKGNIIEYPKVLVLKLFFEIFYDKNDKVINFFKRNFLYLLNIFSTIIFCD